MVLNGGVGISAANDAWAVGVITENLNYKRFMFYAEHAGFSGGRVFTVIMNPRRSVTLRLKPSEFGKCSLAVVPPTSLFYCSDQFPPD